MERDKRAIFRDSSTTYYYSSLFFPKEVRKDVFTLYSFVRTADDFVDREPQDVEGFREFRERALDNLESAGSGNEIIGGFSELYRRKGFRREWVEAFLDSMEADIEKKDYETMGETLEYVHGSAEVIGCFMARILGLEEEAMEYAKMMGRSMQYINFIRDIEEDNRLGRTYLPREARERHGLETLEEEEARRNPERFRSFIEEQVETYREMRQEAVEGLRYIPAPYRFPVATSSNLYRWTAGRIERQPFIVYDKKVRPGKFRIGIELARSVLRWN